GAGVRVVPVEEVLVTEVLEAVHAPGAASAGEDRAQEHPVALFHPGGQDRIPADLLEDPHWLVTQHPRRRRPGIAIEERPGVGAADPARLHLQERALRVDFRLGRRADLHRVHAGHERRSHWAVARLSSSSRAARALSADHRSLITLASARVMASGERCMKMLRPTEQPIAPATIARSIRRSSSASFRRVPPARITGVVLAASTSRPKDSSSPGQLVLTMSAPSST